MASSPDGTSPTADATDLDAHLDRKNWKGPGFPIKDPEVTCPECGRFAGTYERCPFCGASLPVRLSVRMLRRFALILAFFGLGLTLWVAQNSESPLAKVGEFEETMNFAILRVRGKIVSGPFYGDRGDSFWVGVDDGTGRLNARAYGRTATYAKTLDLKKGDQIEVRGSIRVSAGSPPSVSLRVPKDLNLLERSQGAAESPFAPPQTMAISEITEALAQAKTRVRVQAKVANVWTNRAGRGATLLEHPAPSEGKSVAIKLWIFENELSALGEGPAALAKGSVVEVTGRLDLYFQKRKKEREIQIRPVRSSDSIRQIEAPPEVPEKAPEASAALAPGATPAKGVASNSPEDEPEAESQNFLSEDKVSPQAPTDFPVETHPRVLSAPEDRPKRRAPARPDLEFEAGLPRFTLPDPQGRDQAIQTLAESTLGPGTPGATPAKEILEAVVNQGVSELEAKDVIPSEKAPPLESLLPPGKRGPPPAGVVVSLEGDDPPIAQKGQPDVVRVNPLVLQPGLPDPDAAAKPMIEGLEKPLILEMPSVPSPDAPTGSGEQK